MPSNKALKINSDFFQEEPLLIQAIKPEEKKPLKIKRFVFSMVQSAKTVPSGKFKLWKPARLVQGKRKYVEFYYRIPEGLPPLIQALHPGKGPGEWWRFRVFNDINRNKDPEYAKELLADVAAWLRCEFSPFDIEIDQLRILEEKAAAAEQAKKPFVSLHGAARNFLAQYDPKSRPFMAAPLNLFKEYITATVPLENSLWYQSIEQVSQDDVQEFVVETKAAKDWSNTTYNDKIAKLVTFFKFCVDNKYISSSPMAGIKKLKKGDVVKLIPFEDDVIPDVKKKMAALGGGEYLRNWCEVIYYSCMRPDKELRNLQAKHIIWGRHNIDIPEEIGKGGRGRWIFMVPELEELLIKMGVKSCPPEYYIFGKYGPPGPEPVERAFYSDIFRDNIRQPNGLDERLTPYCFKHTRCIHLWQEGVPLSAIQQLCGHSKPSMTERYLSKGLGLALDRVRHDVRRKF